MDKKTILVSGSIAGVITAALEGIMLLTMEKNPSGWMLLQGPLFWYINGVVTSAVKPVSPFRESLHGPAVALIMNIPWLIEFCFSKGNYTMALPMLIASIIFGFISDKIINATAFRLTGSSIHTEMTGHNYEQ